MPLYNITYSTSNLYTRPVREAILELMVLPETNSGQKCSSFNVRNSLGVNAQFSDSLYGARVIRFRIPRKFCSFDITVEAVVEKTDINPFDTINLVSPEVSEDMMHDFGFVIDHQRYLSGNDFTQPVKAQLPAEIMREHGEDFFRFMQRINLWVHAAIKFQPGVTTTMTKLDEIIINRQGVCQDYAHLYIACMRKNGIPARYVSGYLNQGLSFIGASALHAWVETFLPGTGWIGFDPTNNLLADRNYIKIGHGLDYTDCMPIKGIIIAKGTGSTEYSVNVSEQQSQ